MENKDLMTEGSIRRKILFFALNILLGNLFQQLYNTVDSIIVGNFVGSNALAAVSSAGNLVFLIIGLFVGVSVGAGVVISNFIGAKDKERISEAVHSTVALGLASSLLLTLVGVLLAPPILKLINTPPDVLHESVTYFRVYFAGSFGFVMYNTLVGILRATGDSKHPLYYLLISSIINIILDLVFIAGFGMGVGAAAVATAISQVISSLFAFYRLTHIDADYRIYLNKIRFSPAITKKIISYGLPSGLQNSVMSLSNVVIQSYINTFGPFAMAGIGAYSKLEGFVFLPITSFAMAITTFVGQNIGAAQYDRVKKGIRFGLVCTMVSCIAISIAFFFSAETLISLFDNHSQVVAYGVDRARVTTMFFFLCGFTHFMAAVLRGAGRPTATLMVFLICWCAVRMIMIFFFAPVIDSIALTHWVYPATWILSSIAMLAIYKKTDLTKVHI